MEKVLRVFWVVAVTILMAQAAQFSKMASSKPELIQSGPQKMWCAACGMNLKMFYRTSHAVILDNGQKRQYCSMHCLVSDWKNIAGHVKKILAVDAKSEKLIDAKKAWYVIGSSVPGTMSRTSKIAFAHRKDAQLFQKIYGGRIVDFKTAFKMTADALGGDSAMIAEKKKMKMYPMGKKIYARMCQKVDITRFGHINDLKAALKKGCKPMREKQLQAVALYLWDVVGCHDEEAARTMASQGQTQATLPQIVKADKCPVCGMFVYKHPKWAAFIYYEKEGHLAHLAFDGVKDMMKFYLDPAKWGYSREIKNHIKKMVVRDYYTLKPIWAKRAWYVVGSDVYGPMGNELIPFASKKAAEDFMRDHHGKRVLRFDEIDEGVLKALDE